MASAKKPRNTRVDSAAPVVPERNLKDAVRKRAYALYVERGTADGNADEDWRRAEAEILRQRNGEGPESAATKAPKAPLEGSDLHPQTKAA